MPSKIIISAEVLTMQYNKVFAKWVNARGAKKEALGMELERLNEMIEQTERSSTKHTTKTLPKIKNNVKTK